MGTWGTGLYSDDYTCDIRGDYNDRLRRGMSHEEVLKSILDENTDVYGTDDEPSIWYALADIQWRYGHLMPEVKEKALAFLERADEDDRWETPQLASKRRQVLAKLKEKLLSDPPPEKKVSKYQYYHCPWKLGDVFAYQFHTKDAEAAGVMGQYIVFRKITEEWCWPGHIVPVVHIYEWMGKEIPTLEEIRKLPILVVHKIARIERKKYLFSLCVTSKRSVPQKYLTYIGNIQDDKLFEYCDETVGYEGRGWCIFEFIFVKWFAKLVAEHKE